MYGSISHAKQISAKYAWLSWWQLHRRHKLVKGCYSEENFKNHNILGWKELERLSVSSPPSILDFTWFVTASPFATPILITHFDSNSLLDSALGWIWRQLSRIYPSLSFPLVACIWHLAPPTKPNKTSKTSSHLRRTLRVGCRFCAALSLGWRGRARMARPSLAYINRPLLPGSRPVKANESSVLSLREMEWPRPKHIFFPVQNILPPRYYERSSEACFLSPSFYPPCITAMLLAISQQLTFHPEKACPKPGCHL